MADIRKQRRMANDDIIDAGKRRRLLEQQEASIEGEYANLLASLLIFNSKEYHIRQASGSAPISKTFELYEYNNANDNQIAIMIKHVIMMITIIIII